MAAPGGHSMGPCQPSRVMALAGPKLCGQEVQSGGLCVPGPQLGVIASRLFSYRIKVNPAFVHLGGPARLEARVPGASLLHPAPTEAWGQAKPGQCDWGPQSEPQRKPVTHVHNGEQRSNRPGTQVRAALLGVVGSATALGQAVDAACIEELLVPHLLLQEALKLL